MNGYCTLKVEGVEYTLYFGRQAVEEFGRRTEKYLTDNSFKIAVDMVFAGIANNSTKQELPVIPYAEVYELMEKLADTDKENYQTQFTEISNCFWESKYGAEYAKHLKDLKKKIEMEVEEMMQNPKLTKSTGTVSEDTV